MKMLIISFFALLAVSCSQHDAHKLKNRSLPRYAGIDSTARPIVNEYVKLAKRHDIEFTKHVTVGFTNIDAGQVIGVCYRGFGIREIDIDVGWWNKNFTPARKTLLFHELTHCLCKRPHDYGDGTLYNSIPIEDTLAWIAKWTKKLPFYLAEPGRYADGCPLSIMYPRMPSDYCLTKYKKEYYNEMFNRCNP